MHIRIDPNNPIRGDREFMMNGQFEYYFYDSVPTNPDSIIFKTLPFHRIINKVLPPMYITFESIMGMAGPENGKHL